MTGTIVITGAGSGIGRATARRFLGAGWNVALAGRRAEALEETAEGHPAALPVATDVADPASVEALFAATLARFGRVDALFNNAGRGSPPMPIDEMPLDDWFGVLAANLTGSVLCARAAFGAMRAQDPQGGRIINNGSISAQAPRPGSVPYTTTKHAITGLTKTLSLDGRPFDIACCQIDIGNAASEMTQRMARGVPQADGSVRPEPLMDVGVVADTVLNMASLPLSANMQFVTVMATKMPLVGRG
ncbi:NADP-dependent 3-hydroxy acid dehydrogenase YdfG [Albimonas donghaensis]|uniref:NADP-dependent 3-hydroxy acid dehydrogenase YdfG n=1 Tax=Albimonas donghaensis TaxID=356660 RepID=A0A1H3BPR0_9RHOB|nr:SDR family oxidoreductase [Albimonas donghaensis]SDX43952.1 NADP-dependent 3-hydroxy acid dehydrogenase YdfG [Albimonas donghaensis]